MRAAWLGLVVALLAACSSVPESDRPSPLPAYAKEIAISAAWSHELGAWQEAPEGRLQPVLVDGMVVLADGLDWLRAFDARSGKLRWELRTGVAIGGGIAVAGDKLLLGTRRGEVIAYALKDGSLLWEATVATPQGRSELERMVDVDADPVVMGDTVYAAAYQGRVVALSRDSGRVLWARDMSVYNNMTADEHALYLSDDKGAVWAIDRGSGAALWKQEKLRNRGVSAPVLFGDYVVVADYQGYLHWLARDDGHLAGRYHVDDAGVVAAPFPVKNLLYVQGLGGGAEALRAQ